MSRKISVTPVVWLDKPESFYDVGRSLRQAFQPAMTASPDVEADALLKLLMDTPLNDMACC